MKKLLGTLFAATLVLSACSQDDTKEDENKKSENTTEKKSDDKKENKTKEDKKSGEEKKSQEKKNNKSMQESATNEQVQSQQQTQQANQQAQQSDNHEPTKEEIYEWDKQNIPGGTDFGLIDPEDVNEGSESQNEEPDEWIKGQEEWNNATQSEKEELRKQNAQKYGYEYDPKDYEE